MLKEFEPFHNGVVGRGCEHFAKAGARIAKRLKEQVEAENSALDPAALRYGAVRLLPEKHAA